jgi:type II secretory pathway predicted ATPase ExeA
MYTKFYGLAKEPFEDTPDADFLFLSPSHRQALSAMTSGIDQRKGLITITGDAGVGKTVLLHSYLNGIDHNNRTIISIHSPEFTSEELLITLVERLGAQPVSNEATEIIGQLHELLLAQHHEGRIVVLIIDEAHRMAIESLGSVRMLLDLKASPAKLIQIVLVARPELNVLLNRHEWRDLRRRVAVHATIVPLTHKESVAYIGHRLACAGSHGAFIFSSDAVDQIVRTSQGIPRILNTLCRNALIAACSNNQALVTSRTAKEVAGAHPSSEVMARDSDRLAGETKNRYWVTFTAILAIGLPGLLYLALGMPVSWGDIGSLRSAIASLLDAESGTSTRPLKTAATESQQYEPDALLGHLIELEKTLESLSREYTDAHPDVILLKQEIANVRAQLKEKYGSEGAVKAAPIPKQEPAKEEPALDVKKPVKPGPDPQQGGPVGRKTPGSEGVTPEGSGMITEEKVELSETARLLAVLLDCGRVVVGRAQPSINNPRLQDKGFSSSVFESKLRTEFLTRTGHDLRHLAAATIPDRAKPLLGKLALLMQKAVQDVQADINKKGIGFKGFIPATFGTTVAEKFSNETGLKLRQIGPPTLEPRNPDNKPDEQEKQALLVIQKNHPRVGDHVVEQQLPDNAVRVLLPLFYKKPCLACHGKPKGELDISGYEKEGAKEGDLGGAISVILSAENKLMKAEKQQ